MTAKEKQRMLDRAAKLKPKPRMLPSGQWNCQVMVKGERGSFTADTPEEANALAVSFKNGLLKTEKRKEDITLIEAIDAYINSRDAVLSPATVRGYDVIKRNRFKKLMYKRIADISLLDIQSAVNADAKIVSAKTVANAYGLIRPVMEQNGITLKGIKLPQIPVKRKKYLQPSDLGKLMEAAKSDPYETEILLAVWIGLRRSEIVGLCWDCVDFERGTITIKRTVVPDRENNLVIKDIPKNKYSNRTIACPGYIMDKLHSMYNINSSGQIFKVYPGTIGKHVHMVCKAAGVTDTTLHGLRHTNAAVMRKLGVDDAHAMQRGGWSSESTYKKVYSYVFDQSAEEGDTKINEFFENL